MDSGSVDGDLRNPFLLPFVPKHPLYPGCAVFLRAAVRHILRASCFPQIMPPIVQFVHVTVVHLLVRPFSRHPKEDHPVFGIFLPIDLNPPVPVGRNAAGAGAGPHAPPLVDKPGRNTCFGVISQEGF